MKIYVKELYQKTDGDILKFLHWHVRYPGILFNLLWTQSQEDYSRVNIFNLNGEESRESKKLWSSNKIILLYLYPLFK